MCLTHLRSSSHKSCVRNNAVFEVTKSQSDSIMEIYEPFMFEGIISLVDNLTKPIPIKILRYTGASQSIILADVLPFSKKTYSGTSVLLQGVECSFMNVPLHNIFVWSELVTGPVTVGIGSSLPFDGIHVLLGNDLAGTKFVVSPFASDILFFDQSPDIFYQHQFLDLFRPVQLFVLWQGEPFTMIFVMI